MKRIYFLLFIAWIVSVTNQSEACTRVVFKGPLSVKWTSKYGSVIASAWDIATADGMNEKGLVANVLRMKAGFGHFTLGAIYVR